MITTNSDGNAISQACIDAIRSDSREFLSKLLINGQEISCVIDSWTLTKGSCGNLEAFSVGDVFGSVFTAEVRNLSANIKGEDVEVQIGVNTGAEYEYITLGVFNVTNVKRTYYGAAITAYGRTITRTKFGFTPPAAQMIADIIDELETETGCTITLDPGIDDTLEITASMLNMTSYQALSVIASVIGGYACDTADGNIAIHKFTTASVLPVNTGMMTLLPDAEEADFTVSGIKCTVSEAVETGDTIIPAVVYTSGSTVNVEVVNQFMTQDLFDDEFSANLIGYSYRPATINLTLGDPRLEGSDCLSVTDLGGAVYTVPCHSIVMNYAKGFSCVINSARATLVDDGIGSSSSLAMQLTFLQSAAHGAKIVADASYQIAADTNQYFWFTSTGSDTGAHITEVPQDDFTDPASPGYHSGGNLLARSNGIAVRDGMTEVAQFGAAAIQIGADGAPRFVIEPTEIRAEYGDGVHTVRYFDVGAINTYSVQITETWENEQAQPGGETRTYTATYIPESAPVVKINGVTETYEYTAPDQVTITVYDGDTVTITYDTFGTGEFATFGSRGNGTIGPGSFVTGVLNVASGWCARACGLKSVAAGDHSVAEGVEAQALAGSAYARGKGTIAGGVSQTAIGEYNVNDTQNDHALIIGNGTSDSARSNALTVDWNGNVSRYTGWDGSSVSSANEEHNYEALDTSGRWVGRVSTVVYGGSSSRSGQVGMLIRARHPSAPNNPNTIGIYVDDTGAMDYTITDPSKFRSAIGAQATLSVSSSINIASYIASSTGTFVSGNLRTYGKIAHLRLVFKNSGTIAKNGVVYAATLSSYKPVQQVIGVGSNGGNAVACSIDGSGNISARNCGASASFTDTAVTFTYIMP